MLFFTRDRRFQDRRPREIPALSLRIPFKEGRDLTRYLSSVPLEEVICIALSTGLISRKDMFKLLQNW